MKYGLVHFSCLKKRIPVCTEARFTIYQNAISEAFHKSISLAIPYSYLQSAVGMTLHNAKKIRESDAFPLFPVCRLKVHFLLLHRILLRKLRYRR